jgi:thymidylate synthase
VEHNTFCFISMESKKGDYLMEYSIYNNPDKQYLATARDILRYGEEKEDRTGTGTISLFAPHPLRFDLREGFPLLTTKRIPFRLIVSELLWFLRGDTNIKYLHDHDNHIWDADYERAERERTHSHGDLGPIYGHQWRNWEVPVFEHGFSGGETRGIDQIKELIQSIKENPTGRRHIVSAWNVGELDKMALPPCHILFQAYVSNDGGLSLQMYQRSADWFLGVPFNIASYSLLTHLIAQVTGLYTKEFIHVFGDAHVYKNHILQIENQMLREPRRKPTLKLNPNITSIDDFKPSDIELIGYDPHPTIKGKVSVG